MRHLLVPPLLLILSCASPVLDPGNRDAGQQPAACFRTGDSGVFVNGLPAPVPGCTMPPGPTGTLDLAALDWAPNGGVLVVPPAAAQGTPVPVVFVFHGAGGSGEAIRARLGLESATDGGAVFVYPDAALGTWDIRPGSLDGNLVGSLLDRLSGSYCIDPGRVYISGFSAGAVFTLFLGCNVPATFRALAVVAGTNQRFTPGCCKSAISSLFIHGTEDEAIPILEGRQARDAALHRAGCADTSAPAGAYCQEYTCPSPYVVDSCEWSGDHDIPPWAGAEISRFFGL